MSKASNIYFQAMKPIDGIIFDMDGTLWDATDSYAEAWNLALKEMKITRTITRMDLEKLMGLEEKQVLQNLFPKISEEDQLRLSSLCNIKQDEFLPIGGGKLYDGVKEGLEQLAQHYLLFIVSNCYKNTIDNFTTWAGIKNLIKDTESHGNTKKSKADNIKLVIKRNKLKSPVYIGDTESDRKAAHAAGIPFIQVTYGFGKPILGEQVYSNFSSLVYDLILMNNFFTSRKAC